MNTKSTYEGYEVYTSELFNIGFENVKSIVDSAINEMIESGNKILHITMGPTFCSIASKKSSKNSCGGAKRVIEKAYK